MEIEIERDCEDENAVISGVQRVGGTRELFSTGRIGLVSEKVVDSCRCNEPFRNGLKC